MFESLTITRLNDVGGLDLGLWAESLLFYDRVELVLGAGQLSVGLVDAEKLLVDLGGRFGSTAGA
jgi:hypothetical protein